MKKMTDDFLKLVKEIIDSNISKNCTDTDQLGTVRIPKIKKEDYEKFLNNIKTFIYQDYKLREFESFGFIIEKVTPILNENKETSNEKTD